MKNIILISLLIVTSISFSQTLKNNKCDSLKAAYNGAYEEYKKAVTYKGVTEKKRTQAEFDSLKTMYENYCNLSKQYFNCSGDSSAINVLPPPYPPYNEKLDEVFGGPHGNSTTPKLLPESRKKLAKHIKDNYPIQAKESGISGKVRLKFLITKEGISTDIIIIKEKPKDMGFGKVALEAIQKARFEPATQRGKAIAIKKSLWIKFKTPKKEDP